MLESPRTAARRRTAAAGWRRPDPSIVLRLVFLALLASLVPGCRYSALESRIADLEIAADRQAVAQLIHQYAWGLDRGDQARLAAIFLPDAVAEYVVVDPPLEVRLEGAQAILEWLRETDHGRSPPGHYMATQIVEIEGDRARLYAYQHNRDVSGAGLYTLDARRTPDGWRIAKLHLDQHMQADPVSEANEAGEPAAR